MDNMIWLFAAMTVSAAFSFFFGAVRYFKPHKPLYASMIVLGTGCVMIGKAYSFLRLLTGLQVLGIFNIGMLGTVGAFAFFFSSNYGQIDSLVDGGEKTFLKYRIIGISGIVTTLVLYLLIVLSPASVAEKISAGISAVVVAGASYFHVKHILIPDVDYGVVKCLRGYNILALIYGILCMLEMLFSAYGTEPLIYTVCIAECAVSAVLVPVMHKGVLNWNK